MIKIAGFSEEALHEGYLGMLSSFVHDKSPIFCSLRELYWDQGMSRGNDLLFLLGDVLEVLTVQVPDFRDGFMGEEVFVQWVRRLCFRIARLAPQVKYLAIKGSGDLPMGHSAMTYFYDLHTLPIRIEYRDGMSRDSRHPFCTNLRTRT